jgi:hypothetical protein
MFVHANVIAVDNRSSSSSIESPQHQSCPRSCVSVNPTSRMKREDPGTYHVVSANHLRFAQLVHSDRHQDWDLPFLDCSSDHVQTFVLDICLILPGSMDELCKSQMIGGNDVIRALVKGMTAKTQQPPTADPASPMEENSSDLTPLRLLIIKCRWMARRPVAWKCILDEVVLGLQVDR